MRGFNILLRKCLLCFSESMSLVNELFITIGALCCMSYIAQYFLKLNMKSDCSNGNVYILTLEISQTRLYAIQRCSCSSDGILRCVSVQFYDSVLFLK
jgi:hypothetical protein